VFEINRSVFVTRKMTNWSISLFSCCGGCQKTAAATKWRIGPFVNHLTMAVILILMASHISGQPSIVKERRHRTTAATDDEMNDFFGNTDDDDDGDFFGNDLDRLEKDEKMHETIDQGFELWEEKCFKTGGQEALDSWLKAQEDLIYCAMQNFNVINIQDEIAAKKATGELDVVFKKYCGKPVEDTLPCIQNFLEVSRQCLKSEDRKGLRTTMSMINAAINFLCHNSGDRMALFMAEDGVECVTDHQEALMTCVNQTVPDLFSTVSTATGNGNGNGAGITRRRSVDPVIVFNEENCRRGSEMRHCVESELLKCSDPTPSNVINAMFLAMWNSTPCTRIARSSSSYPLTSVTSSAPLMTSSSVVVLFLVAPSVLFMQLLSHWLNV